ncbi:MAG: tol-pal system protein YbgF [Hyphomicrobium sp.]|nr:tol-pal system protein YbgF [Hyphomicrobium sp.]
MKSALAIAPLFALTLAGWVAMSPPSMAQQPEGGAAQAPAAQQAAQQKAKASGGGADTDLRRRVEQLEEQLVDMQVVIGTLESLARSGGAAQPTGQAWSSGASGADSARIDGLETQIRALTAEVERLSSEAQNPVGPQGGPTPQRSGWNETPVPPATGTAPANGYGTSRFGETTVTSAQGDPINGLLQEPSGPLPPLSDQGTVGQGTIGGETRVSPADPAAGAANYAAIDPAVADASGPKQLYERAHGYMLQQNYGAAQAQLTDFLKRYPNDALVPDALFWLGEAHYMQRNFADAAEAFDLVTQGYRSSSKAPDSYMKRGLALSALGKTQDACAVLTRFPTAYPSAAAALKAKAGAERQRIGCP